MDCYPPIAEHGLIGDLQTAALVSTDGTVDWFCCPRFDSPSVFASAARPRAWRSLPDRRRGRRLHVIRQLYFPDTAILITRFMTSGGVGEVIDFMPVDDPERATDRHRLVRAVRCVRGEIRFVLECAPRFDYGRQGHDLELTEQGAVFRTPELQLTLHGPAGLERRGNDVHATMTLQAGQVDGVMLESAAEDPPRRWSPAELLAMFTETARFWRGWLAGSTYHGRWREMVDRSAITLKLMTYAPTGALVAAPTAGLPEQVGGERNWDYRYTWIRDASFSVHALLGLGFTDEAAAFMGWLGDRADEQAGDGIGAAADHVPGRRLLRPGRGDPRSTSRATPAPSRSGSATAPPTSSSSTSTGRCWTRSGWPTSTGSRSATPAGPNSLRSPTGCASNWDQPDEGIWETRGGRQNFTYGRLMCWVALDRMVRLAREHGRPADLARWISERDRIYHQIMDHGWNPERRAFTQHDQTDVLDASLLMMPLTGFVAPNDPMWLSTLDAMDDELVSDSLVYRYNPSASPDGLRGEEGTFSICTFWYVDALARSGRLEQARLTFEKMFTYANHLGLYAEEIGLTGEQLGNFPQAFTHLSLINAAINLNDQLDHGTETLGPHGTSTGPER